VKQQKDRKLTVYEKLCNETVDYIDACFRLISSFISLLTSSLTSSFFYFLIDAIAFQLCFSNNGKPRKQSVYGSHEPKQMTKRSKIRLKM